MTVAARRILSDCEAALEMLEDEQDEQRWRVLWVGALALLRAVGHVLRNVDGQIPQTRAVIDAAYGGWTAEHPEHLVFREFIEKERNNMIKEYRMNVLDSSESCVAVFFGDSDGRYITDETPFVLDGNLFRPVMVGFGVGEDARDVYREAINWWRAELTRLEAVLNPLDE